MICYINYKQIFSEIKQPYLRNITDYYLHNQLFSETYQRHSQTLIFVKQNMQSRTRRQHAKQKFSNSISTHSAASYTSNNKKVIKWSPSQHSIGILLIDIGSYIIWTRYFKLNRVVQPLPPYLLGMLLIVCSAEIRFGDLGRLWQHCTNTEHPSHLYLPWKFKLYVQLASQVT